MRNSILIGLCFWSLLGNVTALAEMIEVEDLKAKSQPTEVAVVNGQASSITFKNGQIIDFVLLPDQSKSVYTPNSPIKSGNATALYLRKIDELNIPGATKSNTPNLLIETLDEKGERHEYEFLLNFNPNAGDRDKITILPQPEPKPKPQPKPTPPKKTFPTIQTRFGGASPEDVTLGLETSIDTGQIEKNGQLAASLYEFISLFRNGVPILEAIEKTNLKVSVVEKLATTGQQEEAKRRILPLKDFK